MLHAPHQPSAQKSTGSVARMSFRSTTSTGTGSDGRSSRASSSLMGMDKARPIASSGRGGAGNIKNAQTHGEGRPSSFYPVDQTAQITGVEVLASNSGAVNTNSGRGGAGNIRRKVKLPSDSQTAAIMSQYEKTTLEYEQKLIAESAARRAEAARAIGRGGAGARKQKPKKKKDGSLRDSYSITSTTLLSVPDHGSDQTKSFGQTVRDKLKLRRKKRLPPTTTPGYEASVLSTIVDISIPFPEDPYSPPPSASLAAPDTLHPCTRTRSHSQNTITDTGREYKENQCLPRYSGQKQMLAVDTTSVADSTWSFHRRSLSMTSSREISTLDKQKSPTAAQTALSRMNSMASTRSGTTSTSKYFTPGIPLQPLGHYQQLPLLSPRDPYSTRSSADETSRRLSYATTTSYATTNSYATTTTQSSYATSYTTIDSPRGANSCLSVEKHGQAETENEENSGHNSWAEIETTPATWLQSSASTPRPRRFLLKAHYCADKSLDGHSHSHCPTARLGEDADRVARRLSALAV